MTHRSRSGGPQQQFRQRKKTDGGSATSRKAAASIAGKQSERAEADQGEEEGDGEGKQRHPLLDTPDTGEILALIRHSLASTITSPDFVPTIQKIKGLLYEKKWLDAFGDETLLEAYAGRWVPSRVLCFRELLAELDDVRAVLFDEQEAGPSTGPQRRVVSLGGGAGSELLALGALVHGRRILERQKDERVSDTKIEWVGVDFGPWTGVLDKFNSALDTLWHLDLPSTCHQMDLLNPPASSAGPDPLLPLLQQPTSLITLLYTMCELMSQSRPATIRLLHTISDQLAPGGLLLVADSASDIAEFELGSSGRKWPVYMVLDAVMLGMKDAEGRSRWEKVESEDSRWYRLGEGVGEKWPVKLENTRYWYRLYRRV